MCVGVQGWVCVRERACPHTDNGTHTYTHSCSVAKRGSTKLSCLDLFFSSFLPLLSLFLSLFNPDLPLSLLLTPLSFSQMFYLNNFGVDLYGFSRLLLLITNPLRNAVIISFSVRFSFFFLVGCSVFLFEYNNLMTNNNS